MCFYRPLPVLFSELLLLFWVGWASKRIPTKMELKLSPDECGRLRRIEPRSAHEHALLAQLPEFYSASPSRERLRAIAHRTLRSTEAENRSIGRAAVEELCPVEGTSELAAPAIALAVLVAAYWLVS